MCLWGLDSGTKQVTDNTAIEHSIRKFWLRELGALGDYDALGGMQTGLAVRALGVRTPAVQWDWRVVTVIPFVVDERIWIQAGKEIGLQAEACSPWLIRTILFLATEST